jgi:thiazole synthase
MDDTPFTLAGRRFTSRLLVGTGKYKDFHETKAAIAASGAEIVTVALRRVNLGEARGEKLQDFISPEHYTYLPNTAGCYTAEAAVRTLKLAREIGGWNLVKLEVIGDTRTLYPDTQQTLRAAKMLVADGFDVMAYTTDDADIAAELEAIGCCAIMPLAAPIGSGLGIRNPENIAHIVQQSRVPVLVDAGIGSPSDAALAMELGCAGVLMNSAIAHAQHPVAMATAMKLAVEAGRLGYLAGRMPRRESAEASSPQTGLLQ